MPIIRRTWSAAPTRSLRTNNKLRKLLRDAAGEASERPASQNCPRQLADPSVRRMQFWESSFTARSGGRALSLSSSLLLSLSLSFSVPPFHSQPFLSVSFSQFIFHTHTHTHHDVPESIGGRRGVNSRGWLYANRRQKWGRRTGRAAGWDGERERVDR